MNILVIIRYTKEAVAQRCSLKKAFLGIFQNSQENICARVSFFSKVADLDLQLY